MSKHTLIIRQINSNLESKLSFQGEESFFLLCKKNGIKLDFACGGKGICGKCKIKFLKGAPIPNATERKFIHPNMLREGYRLACLTKINCDCEIEVPKEAMVSFDIVENAQEICWDYDGDSFGQASYFISMDLGTTTIVMEKRSIKDGKVLDVFKEVNDQRIYGADVVSRMEASINGKKDELKATIEKQIEKGIKYFGDKEQCACLLIAGNTVMQHILMGYDCEKLGKAPFTPETLDQIETEICGIKTYLLPGYSAFVGADIFADVKAIDECLCFVDEKKDEKKKVLLIDLGTNAEIVLLEKDHIYCTATAAGPAFDGGSVPGFFGSDMILYLAKLYEDGKIDSYGTLFDDTNCELSQEKIRELQLAKAAVSCGIDMLLEKTGYSYDDIDQVYLAGGFGYYINVSAAVKIGL